MKKILSLILILGIFLSVFTVQAADEVVEIVVPEKHLNNVTMLKALGIGDYTEKLHTEKITRGEFAGIIAALLDADEIAGAIPFADVDKNSEYYNAISVVYTYGIMNGVSSVRFAPDECITYEQAIKCVVSVLGYAPIAGAFPDGYMNIAISIRLLNGLGTNSDNFTWEKAVQLVVNSFDIAVMVIHGIGTESTLYRPSDSQTILGVYHGIFKSEGKVTDNGITTVTGDPIRAKEFMIVNNIAGFVEDDSMREYIGQNVEFYYQVADDGTRILYFLPESFSDDVLVINADDLITDSESFTKTNVVYKENGKKQEARVHQYAEMIYNGKNFATFLVDDMKIVAGTLKLIDNDDDNVYDLIIADEYKDIVVAAIDQTEEIITDTKGVSYSYGGKVRSYFYDKNFAPILVSSIINGNVISLFESKDGEYRKFVVSSDIITGIVDGYENDGEVERISVDGVYRRYSHSLLDNIANGYEGAFVPEMGMNLKMALNYEGKISVIDTNVRDFMYAYCLGMEPMTGALKNSVQLKVVTEKGDEVILDVAKKVEINGATKEPADVLNIADFYDKEGEFVPQLIRMKVNSKGELKMITTAKTVESNLGFTDKDQFTLDYSASSVSSSGNAYGGWYGTDSNTIFFRLRRDDAYSDPEVSIVKSIPAAGTNAKMYDLDAFWNAGAVVVKDSDSFSNYMRQVLMVTKVYTGFDEHKNPVRMIEGYQQGNQWKYAEAEEGVIDHFIPEGIKIGDIVMIQVDDAKNIRTIDKLISLSEKQEPKMEALVGSGTTPDLAFMYGYACEKNSSYMVATLDNYALKSAENFFVKSVSASANIFVYDVKDKTFRKSKLLDLPINAVRQGDMYNIINKDEMIFMTYNRRAATDIIIIKY